MQGFETLRKKKRWRKRDTQQKNAISRSIEKQMEMKREGEQGTG